jgi:L-rhamnose mutarotase
MNVKRVASVIWLLPERESEYRALHAAVWPEVLQTLRRNGIVNFSIFLRDGLLFSYFEYVGDDFDAAMSAVAGDEATQEWWELTDPCQRPVDSARPGERWAPAEQIFHFD